MTKQFVLKNTLDKRYYTGRFWDRPFSFEIRDAQIFHSEEHILETFSDTEENSFFEYLKEENVQFELVTIYSL